MLGIWALNQLGEGFLLTIYLIGLWSDQEVSLQSQWLAAKAVLLQVQWLA